MASRKKTAVTVVNPSRSIVVPGWRDQAAKSIAKGKEVSRKLPAPGGNFFSFRNGVLTLGGETLDSPMPLVILSYSFERSYYSQQYQADVMATPDCYSYDGDVPHPESPVKQSTNCEECRLNQFGTAQNGQGKGCKEGAKFAAIHADSADSPDKVATATIVQGRLSVLNAKTFRNYVGYFEDNNTPIWQGISDLTVKPDSRSQYAAKFSKRQAEFDDDILDAIAVRVNEADKLLDAPYPAIEAAKPQQRAAPKKTRKF